MRPYAVMWSGGKDSALALARARREGRQIGCLLNFIDDATRRVRFHATRAELIAAQADAIGVELRQRATSWSDFDAAFREALTALAADGYAGLIFGDIHLADVRAWYEERVRAAGLEHVEPLWGEPPTKLLEEFVLGGGRAVITCCELAKLDETWLGRVIDRDFLADIAGVAIDPCGENGEYHSFAFAGPAFRAPVAWSAGPRRTEAGFVQLDLLSSTEIVDAVVAEVVSAHAGLAAAAARSRPKAWGRLAGIGVVAYRERLGRAPGELERRALWQALWHAAHEAARSS